MATKARTIKVKSQTGKSKKKADSTRKALKAGVRVSKNGTVYSERRRNRSDKDPKAKL